MPLTVGIFDSGVGGLAIFHAVRAMLPQANYVYCLDNAHYPYGSRSEEDVSNCTLAAVTALVEVHPVNLVVIACNTASTTVLPKLRSRLAIPVVGVVPAIKPAARTSISGTIGLLATPATVGRPYIDDLIAVHASGCQVHRLGSQRLVALAEAKLRGERLPADAVRSEIMPLFQPREGTSRLDTVVLGCTHFPLLRPELTAAAPWPVVWLDSGKGVAERTYHVAHAAGLRVDLSAPTRLALATRLDADAYALQAALANAGFSELALLPT